MFGFAQHAPTMLPRITPSECSVDSLEGDLDDHNARVLQRVKSTGDDELDHEPWKKSLADVEINAAMGPFYFLNEAHPHARLVLFPSLIIV